VNDLDRMLRRRLTEVRDGHTSELGSELHARREDLFRRVRRRRTMRGAGALAAVTAVVIAAALFVPAVVDRRAAPPVGEYGEVRVETIEGVPGNSLVAAFGDSAMVASDEQMLRSIARKVPARPPTSTRTLKGVAMISSGGQRVSGDRPIRIRASSWNGWTH
jgi:hypothetical protein